MALSSAVAACVVAVLAISCCLTTAVWMDIEESGHGNEEFHQSPKAAVSGLLAALRARHRSQDPQIPSFELPMASGEEHRMRKRHEASVFNKCYFSPLQCTYVRRLRYNPTNSLNYKEKRKNTRGRKYAFNVWRDQVA